MKLLQKLHLSLIFTIPVVFTLIKINATDYDPLILFVNKATVLIGIVWSSYLVIMMIKRGAKSNFKWELFSTYRELIAKNKRFLIISNIVLIMIFSSLLYQIFYFRSIDFVSETKVELFSSNADGTLTKIGDVPNDQIVSFRLKLGTNLLLFRDLLKDNYTILKPMNILPFWNQGNIEKIRLIEDNDHETLKSN